MDGIYTLAKYGRGHIDPYGPAIMFFHHWQKLIVESRGEGGLDPYPTKAISNLDVLIKAIQQIVKNLFGGR